VAHPVFQMHTQSLFWLRYWYADNSTVEHNVLDSTLPLDIGTYHYNNKIYHSVLEYILFHTVIFQRLDFWQ